MDKIINKLLVFLRDKDIYVKYRGLRPLTEARKVGDLELGSILELFGKYEPEADEKILPTLSHKNQRGLSNCSFNAGIAGKEIDEQVLLSTRDATTTAYKKGLCKYEGYADLKAVQEVLLKVGVDEEKNIDENTNLSFGQYINIAQNSARQTVHKIKSYWRINNVDEGLKAIDEGHPVTIGLDWYNGYNQGGGFSFPWLIYKIISFFIGGHALLWKGWKKNYQGRRVGVIQNSYGESWGDKGDLYIDLNFLDQYIRKYGAYCNLDLEYNKAITTQNIIDHVYDGKNIRGKDKGAIYRIYDGYKVAYASAKSFVSWNGYPYSAKGAFIVVPQAVIDAVPWLTDETPLTEKFGPNEEIADRLKEPINDNFKKDIEINQ